MDWMIPIKALARDLLDLLLPTRRAVDVRRRWGQRGSKHDAFAGRWFSLVRSETSHVDDKTWEDLEFPRLFDDLDTTVTPVGSQVLHRRLREYADDPAELSARHALHVRLRDDAVLRERLQRQLVPLQDRVYAHIADALHGDSLEPPTHRLALSLWSAGLLAWLLVVVMCAWSLWWWLALLPVNLVVLARYAGRRHRELAALNGCLRMMRVADVLSRRPQLPMQHQLQAERASREAVRHTLVLAELFTWLPAQLTLLLNVCFLLDLIVYLWTVERFARVRHRLHASFALVGGIDADIALASALVLYPRHCVSELVDTPTLEIVDGAHPLLHEAVSNTVCLEQRSALVTGSNMAGKTTFVKMLATNAILGRTAGFCLASRAVLPRMPVMAAIHGQHTVESGKSHYFAQIEAIRGFLDRASRQGGGLIVLDEPFSGTNTVERIAIARSVLHALGARSLVLVTTHDVELHALLGERYALYHFQEDPDVDGYFDYRLRPGPARTRNAIRMLARMAFPAEIISDAMATAAAIDHAP